MEKVELDKETVQGIYLILCGISYDHSSSEVYPAAIPIMNKAHRELIQIGEKLGFDHRGGDI